ncbi:hypothetical protein M3Y97_00075900 [Aphelenchoides bicaudatus]|nr:hypothetical protein M3Y97_00075900 [Aphelenchoides bicaudatus]
MGRKVYIAAALLISLTAVCGFYILASRDEIEPLLKANEEEEILLPDETTQRVLLDEQLPHMAVLPNSIDEDEADLISRATELRDALLEREAEADLARQYAQTLQPSDFNGVIRGADIADEVPLELLLNDQEDEEPEPLVFEAPRKRDVPEFFIIE